MRRHLAGAREGPAWSQAPGVTVSIPVGIPEAEAEDMGTGTHLNWDGWRVGRSGPRELWRTGWKRNIQKFLEGVI